MSRRRGEFEHRTSIFEGAYRAWSHLGGIDPKELFTAPASEWDPLSKPHTTDDRVTDDTDEASYLVIDAKGNRRCYPYEPLPRSGLAHPFIQAIISPWLGPDAEQDDIQLGLTTLRTWWQHRRKGESHSAKQALGTEKIIPVVEGYTRHFFNLAHCGVVNDGDQPPRTLATKMKHLENEGYSFPVRENAADVVSGERTQDIETDVKNEMTNLTTNPEQDAEMRPYGDPNIMPVIYIGESGTHQILMNVTGITCDHCGRIIETVLNGIQGGQSPIQGILDSVGDRELSIVLIKIQRSSMAKRIAYEATETVKMLGYDGSVMELSVIDPATGKNVGAGNLSVAYDVAAATDSKTIFDWTAECSCSDHSIVKENCSRHSQMSASILDAFNTRAELVREFVTGTNVLALHQSSPRKQNSQKRKMPREKSMDVQSSATSRASPNDTNPSDQMMMSSNTPSFSPYMRAPNVTLASTNALSMQGPLPNQGNLNVNVASNPNFPNLTRQNSISQQSLLDANALLSQYLMHPQNFVNNGNLPMELSSQSSVGAAMIQEPITNALTNPHIISLLNSQMNRNNNSNRNQTNNVTSNSLMNNVGLSMPYSSLNANSLSLHLQMNMQNALSQMQNQGLPMQYSNPTDVNNSFFSQTNNRSITNSTNISSNPSMNNSANNTGDHRPTRNSMQSSNPNSDNELASSTKSGS
jgi:copper chaperone CopZ